MNKKKITEIIITIVLCVVIVVELFIGTSMFRKRQDYKTAQLINIAKNMGAPNTTVENITSYEEVPEPADGDVIKIGDVKIKLSGTADDSSSSSSQYIIYTDLEDNSPVQFSYMEHTERFDVFQNAISNYFACPASTEGIVRLLPVNVMPENLTFYQQSMVDQNIPVVYDSASDSYYMLYPNGDFYYVFSSKKPFKISKDKVTVHYKDPSEDPLREHVYNMYEVDAVANTLASMGVESSEDYLSSPSSNSTKTSADTTDKNTARKHERDVIVSYANYDWQPNGKSSSGSLTIDISSSTARASEWVLKSEHTSYTYTSSGLNLTGLNGKRDSVAGTFELSGKVQNLENYSRPYAIAVLMLDESGQLLGVKVVDCRTKEIEANGVGEFSINVNKSSDGVNVEDIYSVMFKMA